MRSSSNDFSTTDLLSSARFAFYTLDLIAHFFRLYFFFCCCCCFYQIKFNLKKSICAPFSRLNNGSRLQFVGRLSHAVDCWSNERRKREGETEREWERKSEKKTEREQVSECERDRARNRLNMILSNDWKKNSLAFNNFDRFFFSQFKSIDTLRQQHKIKCRWHTTHEHTQI